VTIGKFECAGTYLDVDPISSRDSKKDTVDEEVEE
jgi:hypothetical protein